MQNGIYLDNAATTFPKPEEVYCAMDEVNRKYGVNAGRGSYRLAREANRIIDETKDNMKQLIENCGDSEVVFTPSITIALNQILNGIDFKKNDIIYISPYEHNAVARVLEKIRKEIGIEIKIIPINRDTLEIDLSMFNDLITREKPKCVCCTHISNVTGYILPICEIFEKAKEVGAITVLDAAQSLGLIKVDIKYIDFIAFAGHKNLYGPFGIGGFIDKKSVLLKEYLVGGTGSDSTNLNMPEKSPNRYESSSSNIVAIAGLNAALKKIDIENSYVKEKQLTEYAISKLQNIYGVILYIPEDRQRHIGIISFNIKGMKADDVGTILDQDYDIAVRTGFHCAPYVHNFIRDLEFSGTVRIGIGQFNTESDIDLLCEALEELI